MIMAGLGVGLKYSLLKFVPVMRYSGVRGRANHFAALHLFALPSPATP
jgi:hypothetical protein